MAEEFDGYSVKYYTGKPCIVDGCKEHAGTAWSPLWCRVHDIERRKRISCNMKKILDDLREVG